MERSGGRGVVSGMRQPAALLLLADLHPVLQDVAHRGEDAVRAVGEEGQVLHAGHPPSV